jgi:hypothetical protein
MPRCPVTCRNQIRVAAADIGEIKLRDAPRCPVTCRNQIRIRVAAPFAWGNFARQLRAAHVAQLRAARVARAAQLRAE